VALTNPNDLQPKTKPFRNQDKKHEEKEEEKASTKQLLASHTTPTSNARYSLRQKQKLFRLHTHKHTPPKTKTKTSTPTSKKFFKKGKVKGLENNTLPSHYSSSSTSPHSSSPLPFPRTPARPPANKRECEKIHD
jgi:hypothetical protein